MDELDHLQGRQSPLHTSGTSTPGSLSSPRRPPSSSPGPPPGPPAPPSPSGNGSGSSEEESGQDSEPEEEFLLARIPKIRTALHFIEAVRTVTLASQFDPEELEELLEPQEHESIPPDDPILKLSLLNYVSLLTSSQEAYESVRQNTQRCYDDIKLLSHYQIERRATKLSGLLTWEHHMCIKTCIGFTGPYSDLERCPDCGEHRYDQKELRESEGLRKVPRKVFTTFPAGPQLQARWKNSQMAEAMLYHWRKTEELLAELEATGKLPTVLDDILCGADYLKLATEGKIKKYDSVLLLSLDGAQLCDNKKSDVWIYIWILVDLAPDKRYKIRNILPGGVIPGPQAPGDIDSFLFPGLAHVSALQKEGLPIWDAFSREPQLSRLFILLVLADSIGMGDVSGSVGHHGRKGCRLLCRFKGRNKHHGLQYYPALLRPHGHENHRSSSHDDVDVNSLPVPDPVKYK
jgi:hypothetical protein